MQEKIKKKEEKQKEIKEKEEKEKMLKNEKQKEKVVEIEKRRARVRLTQKLLRVEERTKVSKKIRERFRKFFYKKIISISHCLEGNWNTTFLVV